VNPTVTDAADEMHASAIRKANAIELRAPATAIP
jgi:hypothetical protein